MEKLFTIKETAQILNVHWKTVYRWILEKSINATQIGRAYKISEEEINYIKNNGLRKQKIRTE